MGSELFFRRLCKHLNPRYRRYSRQRLSAETERRNGIKIVSCPYLACGMAQKRLWHIGTGNTAAVVGYADIGYSAVLYLNCYTVRSRVNGVFNQLLYDRCRSFHHLAGGNKLRHLLRQKIYPGHFYTSFSFIILILLYWQSQKAAALPLWG